MVPEKGLISVSNMDVMDAYHRGTLRSFQVRAFACVIPLVANNDCIIICINILLPMGWVDSPKFFCAFSETLTDVVNALLHTSLMEPGYGAITKIPETGMGLPHTLDSLTTVYWYIYDVITGVQGGMEQQCQVFDGTDRTLK